MNPLLVPELFQHVLDYLTISSSEDPVTLVERRTFAALARTCSAFSDPSLNRLWRCLDSLQPLVRSFSGETTLKRLPSPQEWLVINRHSPRIQELTLGTEDLSLHFLQCTMLILPNLRTLRWECQPGVAATEWKMISFSRLWPLCTPNINTLEVGLISATDPGFQTFLECYFLLCPDLRSIKFDLTSEGGRMSGIARQALSQAVCTRTDWCHVELAGVMDDLVLRHLALECPSLNEVSLTLDPTAMLPHETYFKPAETPFPNVTRMALAVWNHLDIVTTLLRARDQAFCTFKVTLRATHTYSVDIPSLLSAIASPRRIHSLQSLMIRRIPRYQVSAHPTLTSETQELSYKTLRPIASLVHLRELILALHLPITIDDGEFAGLIHNWPYLEVLWLTGVCKGSTSNAITLKGLSSLLLHCPKLREINLSLDARRIPSPDDMHELGVNADVRRPLVTDLFLQDSLIQHPPELVEAFLEKYFPSVRWAHTMPFPERSARAFHQKSLSQLWTQANAWIHRRGERLDVI